MVMTMRRETPGRLKRDFRAFDKVVFPEAGLP
jgi:hypothetical protein